MPNVYRKYDSKSGVWADFGDLNARKDIGIVEDTDIAEHTIAAGQYVIWKGKLYTANSAITPDTTLSTSNLTEVTIGGLNELNRTINNTINNRVVFKEFSNIYNNTQYSFSIAHTGGNKVGLMVSADLDHPQVWLVFVPWTNASVNTSKIFGNTSVNVSSASVSNDVITISFNTTIYGGIRVIWMG